MRLIDADAFKEYCREGMEEMKKYFKTDRGLKLAIETTESFLKDIDEQPTVQPQRKKGRWIDFNWNDGDICRWGIKCSECHTEYKHGGEMWHNPKFCPNCGAEMGGAE